MLLLLALGWTIPGAKADPLVGHLLGKGNAPLPSRPSAGALPPPEEEQSAATTHGDGPRTLVELGYPAPLPALDPRWRGAVPSAAVSGLITTGSRPRGSSREDRPWLVAAPSARPSLALAWTRERFFSIPEPASALLMGAGLVALIGLAARRRLLRGRR